MEANEVFEKVKSLFVEDLGIDESKVTMDASWKRIWKLIH